MFLTRWKMMAGILAVSLGGLAAMAGQCTKDETTKGPPAPEMPTASTPAMKPAAAPMMPPPAAPMLPSIPATTPTKPSELPPPPAMLPVIPASGSVPSAGAPAAPPIPSVETLPAAPTAGNPEPSLPPPIPTDAIPVRSGRSTPPGIADAVPAHPPMSVPSDPLIEMHPAPAIASVKALNATSANATSSVAQGKYGILLRVGEGEPLFEVRSGDHLILKVVCEKIDVKSPEKGQGLSAVKAAGRVRFAGFGAEGTCDELQFLAGTGEVAMAGNVKIQVKDKLGRIESELSAETMRYRIDPHTTTGNGLLKP
jgi:hypothetical protein